MKYFIFGEIDLVEMAMDIGAVYGVEWREIELCMKAQGYWMKQVNKK